MALDHALGILYAALLGGALGSFANVLILRWHEGASILGRSACPHCRVMIRPRHMIPVLSWLFLRGRCAECERKIHIQYLLVEIAGVILGVVAAIRHDPFDFSVAIPFWFEFLVSVALLVPVAMDIRWQELPVEYLGWLGGGALLFRMLTSPDPAGIVVSSLLAMAVVLVFFGLQIILSHGKWLGMGDLWFGVFMAGVLGWPLIAFAFYVAYLIGGLSAIIGLIFGVFKRRTRIAFAPMLAAGVLVALWCGDGVIRWIMQAYA